MSIATAITAAQGKVADCYTAISNKGGTLPATQNLANMPTAIGSIPTGGGGSTKYGATVDNFLGNVDANGVLQMPTNPSSDIVFTGVKDLANYTLFCKFYNNPNIACGVSFPDLEDVSGASGLYQCFYFTHITSVSLPKLKTASGGNGLYYAFANTNITSLSLPELETVSGTSALRNLASNCSYLTSVSLPKLKTVSNTYGIAYLAQSTKITTISFPELQTTSAAYALSALCGSCQLLETAYFAKLSDVSGGNIFNGAFTGCKVITDIYFNALTTTSFGSSYINQFNNMFNNNATSGTAATSGNVNVHFPSNLSSTISGLTGYPLFGGASGKVTLLFDLTATS